MRSNKQADRVVEFASTDAAVRSARERVLTDGEAGGESVRTDIATSWRRSLLTGVVPESLEVPYDDSLPTPHRLIEAARPVVDRMAAQLVDTSATFLLANSDAQIVERWACPSFLPTLDHFSVAPGFVYAEDRVGTNGLGCAIEERRLFEVRGPEHFRDCLQSLVCVAAPIVLPTTNVVQGALNVTCTINEANGFLKPLIRHAIADIEQRMLESTSRSERMLLDAFLARSRGATGAVLAFTDGLVMANDAADRFVPADVRTLIWHWASDALRSRDTSSRSFTFGDEAAIHVTATRIGDESRRFGAVVEMPISHRRQRSPHGPRAPRRRPTEDGLLVGRSPAIVRLQRSMTAAVSDSAPAVIVGPAGSGKMTVALAIASAADVHGPPVIIGDVAGQRDDLDLRPGSAVVVRHIDRMPVAHLVEYLEVARARDARVIATTSGADAGSPHVLMFDRRIDVPPLSARLDDLPAIADQLLIALSDGKRPKTLRPDALRTLLHHDWPGNVRELRAVLATAAAVSDSGDIAVFHLPDTLGNVEPDRWSTLESAERQAIMHALYEHDGNKMAAATALGLARSTLYRKLRAFDIDVA